MLAVRVSSAAMLSVRLRRIVKLFGVESWHCVGVQLEPEKSGDVWFKGREQLTMAEARNVCSEDGNVYWFVEWMREGWKLRQRARVLGSHVARKKRVRCRWRCFMVCRVDLRWEKNVSVAVLSPAGCDDSDIQFLRRCYSQYVYAC